MSDLALFNAAASVNPPPVPESDYCPACGTEILFGFVRLNHYCPACGQPLAIEAGQLVQTESK